jgi:hypothetical protein
MKDETKHLLSGSAIAERLMRAGGTYRVAWSREARKYVATCSAFPSISHLDDSPVDAVRGLIDLIPYVQADDAPE